MGSDLNGLSLLLKRAYDATGQPRALEEALVVQRRVLDHTPNRSHNRSAGLTNLATLLAAYYDLTSDPVFLSEAVELQEHAVVLARSHDVRSKALTNLSIWQGELYVATADRSILEQGVQSARDAAAGSSHPSSLSLDVLGCRLDDLYGATGDSTYLIQSVDCHRRAVAGLSPQSLGWPSLAGNLAYRLATLYNNVTPEPDLLREAIDVRRQAVAQTAATDTDHAHQMDGLSTLLSRYSEISGDETALDEAVMLSQNALRKTPRSRTNYSVLAHNHALRLADLFNRNHDTSLIREARQITAEVRGRGPVDQFHQARTRAHLARLDGDLEAALGELHLANDAFNRERRRLAGETAQLRDLAGQVEWIVGDLVSCYVAQGDYAAAVDMIEANRAWLDRPTTPSDGSNLAPTAVAWVAASRWDTVVIWAPDHRDASYQATSVPVDRQTLARSFGRVFGAMGARDQDVAFATLTGMAGQIVEALPQVSRLLIVPVGLSAVLPYGAARVPNGGYLVDQTAITMSPSLAWAISCYRTRPDGGSIGIFHPGSNPELELDEDRSAFAYYFPEAEFLESPTPSEVLDRIAEDTDVMHFACHGTYNAGSPMRSCLELDGALELRTVLEMENAPWLVNLSACETALPDLSRSEQSISFPTCFLLGGAAHALASTWTVSSLCAIHVSRKLYEALSVGVHPAAALQLAIKELKRSNGTPESGSTGPDTDQWNIPSLEVRPFQWATFCHCGSPW